MGTEKAKTPDAKAASRGLIEKAAEEERKTETLKGSELAKGADRVEERSKSSDGKSAGEKQGF